MFEPKQLTMRQISNAALVLFQLKNGCRSLQDLKDSTGLSYKAVTAARDWLIISGVPMQLYNDWITLLDKTYSADELYRWLDNKRCSKDCFKAKFSGRYFNDRVIGEGRLKRLLRSIEARFGEAENFESVQ